MAYKIHKKYISCRIRNLLCEIKNLGANFSKQILYNPLMVCFPFANYCLQMGVTIEGFAEHFQHNILSHLLQANKQNYALPGAARPTSVF